MGVLGFDLGGSVALLVAPKRTLGAAVTVGGDVAELLPGLAAAAPRLTCPWLGIYGERAADDAEIEELRGAAARSEQATDLVTYPATGYRFDADPGAAADAWQRTLNWFDSHLR